MRYGFKTFGALAVALGSMFAIATTATNSSAGGDHYTISYGSGSCKAGSECTVTITLKVTADGYHVNKDFNHKLTAKGPEFVHFMSGGSPDNVFSKQNGNAQADEKSLTMTVKFKSDKKGKVDIGGDYRLLVCTDAQCAPETKQVHTMVDVK